MKPVSRNLAALLALGSTAPVAGCFRAVRRDVDLLSLVRLDGFQVGESVTLRDVTGAEFEFQQGSELAFQAPEGVHHRLACMAVNITGPVLACIDATGVHKFDLADMHHVRVLDMEATPGRVVGALGIVGLALLGGLVVYCGVAEDECEPANSGRPLYAPGRPTPVRAALVLVDDGRRRAGGRRHGGQRATPARITRHWTSEASAECASIPAFLALARDLRRAGAPAALVRAARRAAAEEMRHTRLCTALASRQAGATIEAIVPDVPAAADADHAALLERLAVESFWDGCVAEGAAASIAGRSASHARDVATRDALEVIARDEAGHAALARDVLAFCCAAGGRRIRDELARSIEERRTAAEAGLAAAEPVPRHDAALDGDLLRMHGVADASLCRHAQVEAWELGAEVLTHV